MVRPPSYDSDGMKKGAWSQEEDAKLRAHVAKYGHRNWRLVPIFANLARCGKSCRLRWVNYLQPGLVRGSFTKQEEDLIIELHAQLGNKWSAIAAKLKGRTDNEIKNHWHAHLKKRISGTNRTNGASSAAKNQKSSKPQATSNEYHRQKQAGLVSVENPEIIDASYVNLLGHVQQQGDHLSWANHQSFFNAPPNNAMQDDLSFSYHELEELQLICQNFVMLNNESTCSDYCSSSYTGITSSTAESQGSFSSNDPFGELDTSYDLLLWEEP